MSNLIILDGAMGGELTKRGANSGKALWSAQSLADAPEVVGQIHADYIAAGAGVITTNSYSTIPSYLRKGGLAHEYEAFTQKAGQLARAAAEAADRKVLVAGCLPPLSESYRADLVPEANEAMPVYQKLAAALDPYVDLFLCETMSTSTEAKHAAQAARAVNADKPIWVAWTLAEQPKAGLRSGESIAEAFAAVQAFEVAAYLFNCTTPDAITAGLSELLPLTDAPVGAYPNRLYIPSGWTLDNEVASARSELTVTEYLEYANQWRKMGASIIGGCCGIGPEYIQELSATP